MSAVPFCCFAQYDYAENSIIATSSYRLKIVKLDASRLYYTDCDNPYNDIVSTSSNPNRHRNDDGMWDMDYSRLAKLDQNDMNKRVAAIFKDELPCLKTTFDGRGHIWFQIHTDSVGKFINGLVVIWADAEDYSRISPEKLARLYELASQMSLGVPEDYRDISSHHFYYMVPFRDL